MRGFVALFSRESRDARWHLVGAFALAAAAAFAACLWPIEWRSNADVAVVLGRVMPPLFFALFAASTASELVARDVATRRIEALAVLPTSMGRVWTAKFAFLVVASLAFLAWTIGACTAAVAFCTTSDTLSRLPDELLAGAPYLAAGAAFGGASLFFSTLLERGMTAVLASVVVLVAVACAVQWIAPPAAPGAFANAAWVAAPLALATAFVLGSRAAFVGGPVHSSGKVRLALLGLGVVAALVAPAGASLARGLDRTTRLDVGAGDPSLRRAFLSPDGKWVAVEDAAQGGARRTWIVGVADGSCRPVQEGATWFPWDGPWLPESSLQVFACSFSMLEGPCRLRLLDIEPTRREVSEDRAWRGQYDPRLARAAKAARSAGRVNVLPNGDVTLADQDGAARVVFPPARRGDR